MTQVCIVDDHEVVRDGLRSVIVSLDSPVVEQVWSTGSAADALARQATSRPEFFIVDYRLPDMAGDELCAALVTEYPDTKVVVLTSYTDVDIIERCLQSGASAYVSKEAGLAELRRAFAAVAAGERRVVCCEPACPSNPGAAGASDIDDRGLTKQQLRVLELLATGLTYRQIGRQLCIAESTVRFHITALKQKLGVQTKAELIVFSVRQALVPPNTGRSRDSAPRPGW
ncbi:response regulator transcription factor [Mycolicibacterium septicum]|uniref:response regulator transcription factor n=1 Tax=Mycolicibacterium septicum TaxID=98668 RepID=UPI002360DC97|nr:response regulator transcription factor [Mycolicibacterium septicum]